MATITVTGANGFIGRHLVERLSQAHNVRCAVRSLDRSLPSWTNRFSVVSTGSIGPETDWSQALHGADVVIHLAAIAHRANVDKNAVVNANVKGVSRLTEAAVSHGVSRVVLLSSIGVHGNVTRGVPIDESSPERPHDVYAWSKCRAEAALRNGTANNSLEYVIVRPPLVYGPGAPGNFERLVNWVRREVPLPFAAVDNRRSFISVANLCDFLDCAATHSRAANQEFIVCDEEDVSVPDMLRRISSSMEVKSRLFYVPLPILQFTSRVLGRRADFDRLCNSLQVSAGKAQELLGWSPPLSVREGLRRAVSNADNCGEAQNVDHQPKTG